jgi:ferritin-like protein
MDTGEGRTRREALGQGVRIGLAGAVGAALVPGSAPAAGSTTTATAAGSRGDPPVPEPVRVQRLLSVELLLLFSYQHVLAGPVLGARAVRALTPLRSQEEEHVRALRTRLGKLGGTAAQPPRSIAEANRDLAHRTVTGRLGQLQGDKDALRLLLSVEKVVVGAYFVALTTLHDPSLITLVAEMMANDAQHEAVIGELLYDGDATKAVPSGLVQGVQ